MHGETLKFIEIKISGLLLNPLLLPTDAHNVKKTQSY